MKTEVKSRLFGPPSAAELEAAVYKALRLPSGEESPTHGLAHFLGTITIERNDAALDAALDLWIKRVRAEVALWRAKAPPDWYKNPQAYVLTPEQARCNVLRYQEYLDQVRELGRARNSKPATPHLDRTRYDRFAAIYRRLRHSPDRAGYDAYRWDLSYDVPSHEVLTFAEYTLACQMLERTRGASNHTTAAKPWDTGVSGRFAASFDPHRYTADRKGYRRYLRDHASENVKAFIRRRLPVCLPEKDRTLNSYIFASPGAGKSELLKLLVHSYMRKPGAAAVVVIDVAHDFAAQLRFREFAADDSRLVYIDPYLEYGFTPTINPFAVKGPFRNLDHEKHVKERVAAQVYDVLELLLSSKEGGGFTAPMQPILRNSIRALLDIPNATFERLEDLLSGDLYLARQCQSSTSERASKFFRETFPQDHVKRSCQGLVGRLQASVLASDTFKNLTCGKPTIDLAKLIEERKIIVFCLPKGEATRDVALTFGRLVLATINAIGLGRARALEHERTPTHVIIDEFQNFITDSVFETIEELRKFGVMQTFVQPNLFGRMSTDQRHSFMNGVQGSRFFGKCNEKTAEYVADIAGVKDVEAIKELGRDEQRKEFFVWTRGRPTFLLNPDTSLLKDRHSMPEAEWERVRRRQLDRYYREIEEAQAEPEPTIDVPLQEPSPQPEDVVASRTSPPPRPSATKPTAAHTASTAKPQPRSKTAEIKRPPRKPPGPL